MCVPIIKTVLDQRKHNNTIQSRAVSAYLGLALGDALGATVEFMTPTEIRAVYGVHDVIRGGGWLKLKAGEVTDDTTMALALGNAIIKDSAINAQTIAQSFDAWMKNKPVDIGNTVRSGMLRFRRTGETKKPLNEYNAGNGACMRLLPIALATFVSGEDIVTANNKQAHITHNNPLSDAAGQCLITMTHAIFAGSSLQDLQHGPVKHLISQYPEFDYKSSTMVNPSGFIVDTMKCVFQAFFSNKTFRDTLVDAVNRGGDADTTGAITGMLAGCYYGVDNIPDSWLKKLNSKIKNACEHQAAQLLSLQYKR